MFAGPIFSREALTTPRQVKHYVMRAGYVALLFVLIYTIGQATFGWQAVRNVGDFARFGSLVFQILSVIQLTLILFFSLLLAGGGVAQEKDRQTLILLFMTEMHDRELVLGKLFASLLNVGVALAASVPVFSMLYLLGGVTLAQIGWCLALCSVTSLAAGCWGVLVAFWREKTFQTIAISVVGALLYLGGIEIGIQLSKHFPAMAVAGPWLELFNPYRSLFRVLDPLAYQTDVGVVHVTAWQGVIALFGLSVVLIVFTTLRLRVWYPPRTVFQPVEGKKEGETATSAKVRNVWTNPILWREICTRAYGRKGILIKLAFLLIAALVFQFAISADQGVLAGGVITPVGLAFVVLSFIALLLVNAQAATSLTSERDAKTLELLLVTDLTAREFLFGKIGGILYNTKEVIVVPLLVAGWSVWQGNMGVEGTIYLVVGYIVLVAFTTMLGLHSGLSYENSRSAIANSLGTVFFLFVGTSIFMVLLIQTRASFFLQFQSFIVFIGVGSIGLYASLTQKNPSLALTLSAGLLPFLTFYAITEYLLGGTLGVSLVVTVGYGFPTVAMLIPAISEFDVALGRTTLDKG